MDKTEQVLRELIKDLESVECKGFIAYALVMKKATDYLKQLDESRKQNADK